MKILPVLRQAYRFSVPLKVRDCQLSRGHPSMLKGAPVWENKMKKIAFALAALVMMPAAVIHDTPEWKGERFPDGRPKVWDSILDRMKNVTLEEAWATLRNAGYEHQYEDGWFTLFPDKILVGRALTSTW